jgi:hypothetical protein
MSEVSTDIDVKVCVSHCYSASKWGNVATSGRERINGDRIKEAGAFMSINKPWTSWKDNESRAGAGTAPTLNANGTGSASADTLAALPYREGLPHMKVLYVGPAGSGKTMQLAAMHQAMSVGDGAVRVRAADEKTLGTLGERVSLLLGDSPELPAGNLPANTDEWNFFVEALGHTGPDAALWPLFYLSYLDYAGELGPQVFTSPQDDRTQLSPPLASSAMHTFRSAITDSDVRLGVLDGAKIAQAMDEKLPQPPQLQREIWHTLELLSQPQGNQEHKVTHLVLTKWDEVAARGIRLEHVVEYLHRNRAFQRLCETYPRKLRLIPVSALGVPPFLSRGHDGLVSSGEWNPYNPGAPLACSITDIVAADLARMKAARPGKKDKTLPIEPTRVFLAVLAGLGLLAFASHPVSLATAATVKTAAAIKTAAAVKISLDVPVVPIIKAFEGLLAGGVSQSERAEGLVKVSGRDDQPTRREATANLLAYCAHRAHELEEDPATVLKSPQPVTSR